jgi:hypothetical protein
MLGEADRFLVKGWSFAASNKGWSNQEQLGYQWLTDCFNPQTQPLADGTRQLLIVDCHGSHLSAQFVQFCMTHNIDLLVLPPHTSHVLQPLDVGVFEKLKKELSTAAEQAAGWDRYQ